MGLYDDLPAARDGAAPPTTSSWSARPGLAPAPRRQAAGTGAAAPPPTKRQSVGEAAGPPPGRQGEDTPAGPRPAPPTLAASAAAFALDDEYDPLAPNDYLSILAARRAAADEAAAATAAARAAAAAAVSEAAREAAAAASAEAAAVARARAEALTRRAAAAGGGGGASAADPAADAPAPDGAPPAAPPPPPTKGLQLAARMMAKMGWRAGAGLGRDLQGGATPLIAHRTGRASGVVAPAAPLPGVSAPADPAASAAPASAADASALSRVVLLTNMVLPGQADARLEDDVGEEATRHGGVTGVVVFEVTDPGFPPAAAVRVFVRFADPPSAAAFAAALAGRYFGGRRVRAVLYPEAAFAAGELAPGAGRP